MRDVLKRLWDATSPWWFFLGYAIGSDRAWLYWLSLGLILTDVALEWEKARLRRMLDALRDTGGTGQIR